MADSQAVVKALMEVDPQFSTLCDTMFGPTVDADEVWEFLYTREGVSKMNPAPSDVATSGGRALKRAKGVLKPLGYSAAGGVAANQLPQNQKDSRRIGRRKYTLTSGGKTFKYDSANERNVAALTTMQMNRGAKKVQKADTSVTWGVEFSKVDDDKRQVFGWASIVKMDGQDVVDRQGDWIDTEEIEKAAYAYVEKSRKGGNQHKRTADDQPFQASDMIESIVFTDEKIAKMGLPEDFPHGWWVGYQVRDEDTWQDIKAGRKTGFSIHGRGRRQEVAT